MKRRTTLFLSFVSILLVMGSIHYGGPEGVLLRIEREIARYRPHPQFVPTPLATTRTAALLPTWTPTPSSTWTATPTVTPSPPQSTVEQVSVVVSTATATFTSTPLPTATATVIARPVQPSVALTGFRHEWQTWNNCGPATLAMALSYFGSTLNQANIADVLRPNREDKNVSPHELAGFARSQGYQAMTGVNGTPDLLRLFLSNGLPVIIETWHIPEPDNGMGHYRLLTGYDEANQRWIGHDSYDRANPVNPNGPYQGIYLPYTETGELWDVFNRVFVVIYTEAERPIVESILGERMDETIMWQQALVHSRIEVQIEPENAFAWFNLGSNLVALGQYEEAAIAYDQARRLGLPWRMLWYQFGPFEAYHAVGRYEEVISLVDATLRRVEDVEELHYWKGQALLAHGDRNGARRSFARAAQLNVNYVDAMRALADLSP
ncbi:MAG: C39 family peptidase [Caldilineaceae bacterium]|nr:C39 family peptidase [Caldilineaceae bacterium]